MLKKVVSVPVSVVKHVKRHKGAYIFGTIALALFIGNMRNLDRMSEFLTEKGIDPNEFFLTPEDFAEYLKESA